MLSVIDAVTGIPNIRSRIAYADHLFHRPVRGDEP